MNSLTHDPIQMLWVRGELSRMEILSVKSFLANGHPVHFYTYDSPRNLPAAAQVYDAAAIVPRELAPAKPGAPFSVGTMASFSDYFRYLLLLERGGWWSDLDVVCLRPWQFPQPALTASTDEFDSGRIANNFVLHFPPVHPVMAACVAVLRHIDLAQVGGDRTGPLLLHQILSEQNQRDLMLPPSVFAPVPWNAAFQFVRPLWQRFTFGELKQRLRRPHLSCRYTRDTVGIHLWHDTWRHAGRDKHAFYPRSCLYERLQRRYNPAMP